MTKCHKGSNHKWLSTLSIRPKNTGTTYSACKLLAMKAMLVYTLMMPRAAAAGCGINKSGIWTACNKPSAPWSLTMAKTRYSFPMETSQACFVSFGSSPNNNLLLLIALKTIVKVMGKACWPWRLMRLDSVFPKAHPARPILPTATATLTA